MISLLPLPARLYSYDDDRRRRRARRPPAASVDADRGDLGVAVGDLRDLRVGHEHAGEPRDLAPPRRCPAGIRGGRAGGRARCRRRPTRAGTPVRRSLVDDDESAVERDAGLFEAEVRRSPGRGRPRRAGSRPSNVVAVLERDGHGIRRSASPPANRTPSEYAMPRRRNARSSPLLIATSSFGTRWSAAPRRSSRRRRRSARRWRTRRR